MMRIWTNGEARRLGGGQTVAAGSQLVYRCDGCGRRLRVEWLERNLKTAGSRQQAAGSERGTP
jgi:hypothetical protein